VNFSRGFTNFFDRITDLENDVKLIWGPKHRFIRLKDILSIDSNGNEMTKRLHTKTQNVKRCFSVLFVTKIGTEKTLNRVKSIDFEAISEEGLLPKSALMRFDVFLDVF